MSIWCEKYRPHKLEDVILAPQTRKILKNILESLNITSDFTNLLFTGSAGCGKTTSAKLIPKTLDLPCLYINASEENSVDVLRTKVKDFATSRTIDDKLKIVILDEADFISINGMAALRNIIESTHQTTRYILTANYPEKIIAPLHSRLKEIVFSEVDEKQVLKRTVEILKTENIQVPKEQIPLLQTLVKKFHPDIRKILNHLQSFSNSGTLDIVIDGIISLDIFENLLHNIKTKKFSEIRTVLRNNKLDYNGLVKKFFDEILDSNSVYFKDLNEAKRAELILLCADTIFKSNFVVDPEINFAAFCVEMSRSI